MNYDKCIKQCLKILIELSDIRDEIEIEGDGYESKLDKDVRSIEKKVEKLMKSFEEKRAI